MAYNFKNALVNLNEEIRKSGGGGGGQIAADVAALKVSVLEIRSSVAGINQDIDTIKATLAAFNPSTNEHIVGEWIDGSKLYERTWDFGNDVQLASNTWVDTTIPNTGLSLLTNVKGISSTGNFRGQLEGSVNPSGSYIQLRSDAIASSVRYVTLQYTKIEEENLNVQ